VRTARLGQELSLLLIQWLVGPRALARNSSRPLRRFLSTETESIEASTENSLKQLQSLEAQLNTHLQQPVPSVDPETHGTSESVSSNVAEQYHLYKQQCRPSPIAMASIHMLTPHSQADGQPGDPN
jgi:hypothetical protein